MQRDDWIDVVTIEQDDLGYIREVGTTRVIPAYGDAVLIKDDRGQGVVRLDFAAGKITVTIKTTRRTTPTNGTNKDSV